MEARERLARIISGAPFPSKKSLAKADAVIAAFHLTDTAALALMEGEGVVVPNYPAGDVIGPCICGSWPGGRCLKCQTTTNPPYKENPND